MSVFVIFLFPWRKSQAEAQEEMSGCLVSEHHIETLSNTGSHKRPLLQSCPSPTASENRGLLQRRLNQGLGNRAVHGHLFTTYMPPAEWCVHATVVYLFFEISLPHFPIGV